MKMTGLIGVVVGGLSIALGATLEGSNVMAVINIPALFIVLGGTLGACIGGTSFEAVKAIPMLYKKAFMPDELDLPGRVAELVGYAEKARRDGLLALDEQLSSVEDPYTRKGLQLVVDGTDPDLVAEVLEAENDAMRKRHAMCVQPFDKAGGYAPTMGIIGTVFGLVHVLTNLSQPETLGPMISAAFIATLLGVASANVVYLPVSARLKGLSQEELHFREMTLEGILAIQAGENPRFVNEKLMAYVPPSRRPTEEEAAAAASGAGAGATDAEKAAA
jgi:chemotaxis protein MotA